ncbi:microfibril-associated glycoprotein 4-like [Alosa pseudoharengus]|uniref:microfibril-associated glycoprotein 4-like n=1 Tax=Alosa pseudoharengus TaxID=34774 RepID=UPI003F8BA795
MQICWIIALILPLVVNSVTAETANCEDIFKTGHTLSGVYTIYPTGPSIPVQVYCDMGCGNNHVHDEGRWTVIQRRMDGTVNFYRPWDQYKKGFGNQDGEYWLGLEWLHQLTRKKRYELRVDMEDFEGGQVHAQYSTFSVASEADGYQLQVSGYKDGGAGDALIHHNGRKFTTFDRDHDLSSSENCALFYFGAFWYNNCHHTNPNGLYMWGAHSRYGHGVIWHQWKGFHYSLKSITMKIRPVY